MITNKYETMMIFSTKNGEESVEALQEKFKKLIEDNGTMESVDVWGKRRLAYLVDDQGEGYYVLFNYSSGSEFPAELDRVAKITDGVLRTLIIRKED